MVRYLKKMHENSPAKISFLALSNIVVFDQYDVSLRNRDQVFENKH